MKFASSILGISLRIKTSANPNLGACNNIIAGLKYFPAGDWPIMQESCWLDRRSRGPQNVAISIVQKYMWIEVLAFTIDVICLFPDGQLFPCGHFLFITSWWNDNVKTSVSAWMVHRVHIKYFHLNRCFWKVSYASWKPKEIRMEIIWARTQLRFSLRCIYLRSFKTSTNHFWTSWHPVVAAMVKSQKWRDRPTMSRDYWQ